MTRLLDINVLLALAWPQHVHHARAKQWVLSQTKKGKISIATCPITQLGFVRISMNMKGYAADYESASLLLASLVQYHDFEHSFWMDDFSLLAGNLRSTVGPNQLTDAYLVALAERRSNAKLVTFDTGIKGECVELIND